MILPKPRLGVKALCPVCQSARLVGFVSRADGIVIARCTDCGMATVPHVFDSKNLNEMYQSDYYSSSGGFGYPNYENSALDNEEFLVTCDLLSGELAQSSLVLEIGCATGVLLDQIRQRGFKTIGVELSEWAAEQARERGHEVYVGTLEEWTTKLAQADAVVMLDVIEHVQAPRELVSEAVGALRPGGLIVIGTPDFSLYSRCGASYSGLSTSLEHLHYFDERSLSRLLDSVGCDIVSCVHCNPQDPLSSFATRTATGRATFGVWKTLKTLLPQLSSAYHHIRSVIQGTRRYRDARSSLCQSVVVVGRSRKG